MAASGRPIFNRFTLGVATLAVLLATVVIAVSALRAADAGPAAPDQADPLPVAVQTVRFEDGTDIKTRFPALIAARRDSALGFDAGGRIAEIGYDVGDTVQAGAVLAALDTRSLEAQLASARSQVSAAEARADLAEVTLDRQRRLVEQGHVSPQRLDEAGADARSARAQAQAARAEAQSLQVRLDLSRLEAPFSGVITERFADEGAIANPGAPVLRLVEDGALELRAGLPEGEARTLEPGASYTAEIDGREVEVTFRAATGVIDSRRRAVTAVFDLRSPEAARSGEVARLILPTRLADRGFWAPVTALSEGRRGLWSVYALVRENGHFILEPRPVEILHTEDDRVYLSGAVEAGADILSAGVNRVAPGQIVRPASQG
mgnify:CR=1 FL=1